MTTLNQLSTFLQNAATFIRIAGHAIGTHAFIAAALVDTLSAIGARIAVRRALIIVEASLQRIALEANLAHALRRIGRRALGVDAARVPFAWVLALAAVAGVQEEWRRANALAGLDAFFVGAALAVGCASSLRCRALSMAITKRWKSRKRVKETKIEGFWTKVFRKFLKLSLKHLQ